MNKGRVKELQRDYLKEKATHGSPGFPLKVYRNDFNENIKEQIPWHWHEELEFAFIVEGSAQIQAAAQSHILKEGEGMFLNSNVYHRITSAAGNETKLYSVVLHPVILGEDKNFLLTTRYILPVIHNEAVKCQLFTGKIPWQREILLKLRQICYGYEQKGYAYEYQLHNLICDIWLILLRESWQNISMEEKNQMTDEKRIYPALEYIRKHYAQPITIRDICQVMHLGKSECFRCFKRCLMMSPVDYLLHYRVSVGAMLLRNTDESVAFIASECGFNSPSYFCKVFRQVMGCSPGEYRRAIDDKVLSFSKKD